jgi:hypothetical protein
MSNDNISFIKWPSIGSCQYENAHRYPSLFVLRFLSLAFNASSFRPNLQWYLKTVIWYHVMPDKKMLMLKDPKLQAKMQSTKP